jgi:murein DD-endopeptidase MepM/ murein hydrolase activator NlpD
VVVAAVALGGGLGGTPGLSRSLLSGAGVNYLVPAPVVPGQVVAAPGAQGASLGAPGSSQPESASAPDAAQQPQFVMHMVAEGDSLGSIAERYSVDTQSLIWNNPETGADPDMLLIGEELVVPSVPGIVYDVRLGDTVSDIAARYSIDSSAIVSYAPNKLEAPDFIVEGMVLLLPGGVPPAPPPAPEVIVEDAPLPEAPAPAPQLPARAPPIAVRESAAVYSSGFIWPVNGTMWGGFGARWGSFHKGIDVGAAYGTAVVAAGSGQVVLASSGGGYGNYIIVRHGNGLETLYAHLSAIYVGIGQYVGQGEVIGAVGCTGWCTGNHLHFEVYVGGAPVNPLLYLP